MTLTLTATAAPVFVALTDVFVLADHIPAVAVDHTGTASCPDCGTDLGQLDSLAGAWVDLVAVDIEAYELHEEHLNSGEATRDCLEGLD